MDDQQRRVVLAGALVGAVLGAGIAYLLKANASETRDEAYVPLKPSDLISLTAAASVLIRKFNDLRLRI